MFMYSYVCSVLGIVFHCVVLCIVCVYMCTVLRPPGVNPIAVNKYIIIIIGKPKSMKRNVNKKDGKPWAGFSRHGIQTSGVLL